MQNDNNNPSESGKVNALLNLIQQDNNNLIDKIYLYAKDLEEPKYLFLIKTRENVGIKNLNDSTVFTENSNTMDDVYNNIDDYNPKIKRKVLIVFDGMIANIMTNKMFQTIIQELFIRCRKLKSGVHITKLFFCSKRSQIKWSILLDNENSQQKRIKTNCY